MCMDCAKKVGSKCPICRAGIEKVELYGNAQSKTDCFVNNPLAVTTGIDLAASAPPPADLAAEGSGGGDDVDFIPSAKFVGVRDGYFFNFGDRGAGYYRRDAFAVVTDV